MDAKQPKNSVFTTESGALALCLSPRNRVGTSESNTESNAASHTTTTAANHTVLVIRDNVILRTCGDKMEVESVVVPLGVQIIGPEAFYRCRQLTSLALPDTLTHLGNYAFLGCSPGSAGRSLSRILSTQNPSCRLDVAAGLEPAGSLGSQPGTKHN